MSGHLMETIRTERLLGRRLQQEHFDFVHTMHQNEKVMAHLGGKRSDEETREYFKKNLAHWDIYGYGIWILQDRTAGCLVGRGGIRHAVHGGNKEVEVAYGFLPAFWNKGLATEFVTVIIKIGLIELGFSSLVSVTTPSNLASKRVLKTCGFEYERDVPYRDKPHLLYRRNQTKDGG